MRSTSAAVSLHAGHFLSDSKGLLTITSAHSMQKRLCPQGTRAATTSASSQILHTLGIGELCDSEVSLREQLFAGLESRLWKGFICVVKGMTSLIRDPGKRPREVLFRELTNPLSSSFFSASKPMAQVFRLSVVQDIGVPKSEEIFLAD